jgi:hypothetical protein
VRLGVDVLLRRVELLRDFELAREEERRVLLLVSVAPSDPPSAVSALRSLSVSLNSWSRRFWMSRRISLIMTHWSLCLVVSVHDPTHL